MTEACDLAKINIPLTPRAARALINLQLLFSWSCRETSLCGFQHRTRLGWWACCVCPVKSCSYMATCGEERLTMLQTLHLPPEFGVPLSLCCQDSESWAYWLCMLFISTISMFFFFFFCWQFLQKYIFIRKRRDISKFLVLDDIWVCVCFAIKILNGS